MKLNRTTGLDPDGIKIRAAEGLHAADYLVRFVGCACHVFISLSLSDGVNVCSLLFAGARVLGLGSHHRKPRARRSAPPSVSQSHSTIVLFVLFRLRFEQHGAGRVRLAVGLPAAGNARQVSH